MPTWELDTWYRWAEIPYVSCNKGTNFPESSNSLKEDSLLNPKILKWSNSSTLKLERISNISYEFQRLIFVTETVRNLMKVSPPPEEEDLGGG